MAKRKLIARIGVKPWDDPSELYLTLPLSEANPRELEVSPKDDAHGRYWISKLTATLTGDIPMLHEPCILKIRFTDGYCLLGTADLPCRPIVKEGVLYDLSLEYKSRSRPAFVEKVLYYGSACD